MDRQELKKQVDRRLLLATMAQISEIYVVMSTHPNESAVEVHSAHLTAEGATLAKERVELDAGEEGPESELDVWIETVKVTE